MPGTPCRPCRLSWINEGNKRTHPKGRALAIGRRGGRRRSTSRPRMHRFATSSRYPRSQSSSRARRGPKRQWSPTEAMLQRRQRLLCWPSRERFSIGMQTYRRGT
jgi:hypothetical protein